MNKKAFTLIEVLVVLIIVSVLVVISIPSITEMLEKSKQKSKEEVITMVKNAAEMYALDYKVGLAEPIFISDLCKSYLSCPISNPTNSQRINGYLYGKVDTNNSNAIVYELVLNSNPDHEVLVSYLYNLIVATVGTKNINTNKYAGNGLYKWDNKYIYRGGITKTNSSGLQTSNGYSSDINSGSEVNNYIVVPWDLSDTNCFSATSSCYRIMGINEDGTINIIRDKNISDTLESPFEDNLYSTSGYEKSVLGSYKLMLEKRNTCINKVNTVVGVNNSSYASSMYVKDSCNIQGKGGVTPVYPLKDKYVRTLYPEEYLNASTEPTCDLSSTNGYQCRNQNYLYNSSSSRTIITSSSNPSLFFGISISGNVYTFSENPAYALRPVVTLIKNIIVTSGNGTQNNPYIIAN